MINSQSSNPLIDLFNQDLIFCNEIPCRHYGPEHRCASLHRPVPSKPFIIEFFYIPCQSKWYACPICDSVRTQFKHGYIVNPHVKSESHRNKLSSIQVVRTPPSGPTENHPPSDPTENHLDQMNPIESVEIIQPIPTPDDMNTLFPHCSPTQKAYFYNEYKCNDPLGYLVSKAIYGNPLMKSTLTEEVIDFHMTLASLCSTLTKQQKEQQAKVLFLMSNMLMSYNCTLFNDIKIPTSFNEINNLYIVMKKEILEKTY